MTVGELIDRLGQFDATHDVYGIGENDEEFDVHSVEQGDPSLVTNAVWLVLEQNEKVS